MKNELLPTARTNGTDTLFVSLESSLVTTSSTLCFLLSLWLLLVVDGYVVTVVIPFYVPSFRVLPSSVVCSNSFRARAVTPPSLVTHTFEIRSSA